MKITLIIPSFFPAVVYGGPIFSTYHACDELSKLKGVDIRVSTTNTNMNSRLDIETNKWLPLCGFYVKYYNETIIDKFSLSLFFNIWRDIKNTDVMHVQSIFNTPTPIALFYSLLFRKKVLLSPRGSLGYWCLEHGSKFKKYWLKYAIKPFLKNVIWHSTAQLEKDEILKLFPEAKVEIIPNGIEYEKFQKNTFISKKNYLDKFSGKKSEVDKIMVSMGRIQEKKGFDILINSFVVVLNEFPNSKLLIAGDDEGELKTLLALVNKLQLSDSVFFIGSVSDQDKIDFLANADLFVLPSHNENFGNVYIESLAAGTPIVASTHTPWAGVDNAHCGKWVDNTVEKTAYAMIAMLKEDRDLMRKNAKLFARKYDWKNVAQQFRKVFEKMVINNER